MRAMNWDQLTDHVVTAATKAFRALMAEKPDEHFYAFALYTDEFAETVVPSANSIERYEEKVRNIGATEDIASYKWSTAEWAYEAKFGELFKPVYSELKIYRANSLKSDADYAPYKQAVHKCMIAALKRMDENGFFVKARENITLFISSSDDDEAFELENYSAKQLNAKECYLSFLQRYGNNAVAP